MSLEGIFEKIKELITGEDEKRPADDPDIRPASEDPYGDPADQEGPYTHQDGYTNRDIAPASQDVYGGPSDADQGILPASQDPYGDPADTGEAVEQEIDIRPASEDPYGDPADDPRYRGQ
jgi:hypothetical protein